MGVLDTFYVLFKTDADKAAKEIRDVDRAADAAQGGLMRMDAAAAGLSRSFLGMAATLAAPIIALVSLSGALNIAFERANAIDDIGDAAGKLRTSVGDYDAFTRAVQGTGGALADAQQTLASFNDKLNDAAARPDGPNAKNFAKWKIAFKDTKGEALGAVDGILSLAKSLEKVSQAEAIGRLKRLGITDADTIAFLLQGKAAIVEKMEAEKAAGVVTERQVEIIGDYQSAVGQTKNTLDTFANRITEVMIPAITKGYQAFNTFAKWVLNNETLVKGFFIGVATVITVTFLPAITAAAAATIAATWPFLAIGAAIAAVGAAFALAYEDVSAFLNGQPSLIGELADKYKWLGDSIKFIGDNWHFVVEAFDAYVAAFTSTWSTILEIVTNIAGGAKTVLDAYLEIMSPLIDAWTNLFTAVGKLVALVVTGVIEGAGKLLEPWSQAFSDMSAAIDPFKGDIQEAVNFIIEVFKGMGIAIRENIRAAIQFIADQVQWVADKINGILSTLSGGVTVPIRTEVSDNAASTVGAMFRAKSGLADASGSPLNNTTPGSAAAAGTVTNNSNVSVGGVTVNTQATDAKAIAGQIKGALHDQLRQTGAGFDDGVAK